MNKVNIHEDFVRQFKIQYNCLVSADVTCFAGFKISWAAYCAVGWRSAKVLVDVVSHLFCRFSFS